MSELIAARQHGNYRHLLMSGASALAMLVAVTTQAAADDQNHFTIELGGQYGIESGGASDWLQPAGGEGGELFNSGGNIYRVRPSHSWNLDGAVKFQPAGMDLIFKLGAQFGRTGAKHNDRATTFAPSYYGSTAYYTAHARHREEHVKVDFQVGKDFGLGMFGNNGGTSIFSVGIRYAQYNTRTNIDFSTSTKYFVTGGTGRISRRFVGVGPMISWEASAPLSDDGFGLDWGAELAVLFGRQKTQGIAVYNDSFSYTLGHHRNTTVPEVGGFMGISWTCPDAPAKVTFGYKVDALFNVLDSGLYNFRDSDRITHGPFLKVAVGVN